MKSFVALGLTYLVMIIAIASQPEYRYHICGPNSTFASNSPYESTRNRLLGDLSVRATSGEKFYRLAANSSGITVYGSYLCREDVDAKACGGCVGTAADTITERCPSDKETIIWYDVCILRYANRSFFNALETDPAISLRNRGSASGQSELTKALTGVMSVFETEAENAAKSFLTKEIRFSGFNYTIYSLMQCTPDLSGSDCTKCLKLAISILPECCSRSQGANIMLPSCIIRYEIYPFYELQDIVRPNNPAVGPATPPSEVAPRPPTSPSGITRVGNGLRISGAAIAGIVTGVIVASSAVLAFLVWRYRRQKKIKQYDVVQQENDSLHYELITVEIATKNFSQEHKLGEGGFGEVYKGILSSGQEIAVKRLSKSSGQGVEEFKTEVGLVAKLQHRNLVRLLGYCLGGGETLLVYEFVPNKSLDYFLFDPEKRGLLDWLTRSKIIGGICRGILYLHEDSRLRVIHRDLKASNILLDEEMNPKISDFGMARMVGIDQTQGNTKRIVGTYGYMAPEYAMEGLYSVKSDVFSFGVLLLEILSGKKNSGFHQMNSASSLLAYAWQLWNEGRVFELMDELLGDRCPQNEFVRYVHIGLLCVQEEAYNRPTMSTVVMMLTSESTSLPKPERPAFSVGRLANDNHQELCNEGCSENGLSISHFAPR